jgi:hypothetical protein
MCKWVNIFQWCYECYFIRIHDTYWSRNFEDHRHTFRFRTDTSSRLHPPVFRCKSGRVSTEELHWRHERQQFFHQKLVSIVIYHTNDRLQDFHYMTLRKLGVKCWTALGWLALNNRVHIVVIWKPHKIWSLKFCEVLIIVRFSIWARLSCHSQWLFCVHVECCSDWFIYTVVGSVDMCINTYPANVENRVSS